MADHPARPLARHELEELLEDPLQLEERDDAERVIPLLPAQSFVKIARKLRDEVRLDLALPHATPEQLTSLMDLDVWEGERVDVERARAWISAIAHIYRGNEAIRGRLIRTMYGMDPEMWTFALAEGLMVAEIDPEVDDSRDQAHERMIGLQVYETPDFQFVVGAPSDEPGRQALEVIRRVYEDSVQEGASLARSIMSLVVAEAEEDLLRWRQGRLADLGFVAWDLAMNLFRPLDRSAALDQEPRDFQYLEDDGISELTNFEGHQFLRRVMERLEPGEHGLRAREFLLLVNEVSAAQRFDPGDEALQQRAIDQTQATLGLGLELLATARPGHPDPDALAAERVQAIGLRDVFRVGYGALDKLRRTAVELHRQGRVSMSHMGSLLDRPWGPGLAALGRRYPELPITSTSKKTRPIRTLQDVARATQMVAEAGALAHLTFHPDGYGVDASWIPRVDEPEKLTLGDLVRTAVIHAQLPGSLTTLAPLSPNDVAWARDTLLNGNKLAPKVVEDFRARLAELGLASFFVPLSENLLTRLLVELASLETDEKTGAVDLTTVGGLLTIQSVSMWIKTTHGVA